MKAFTLIEMVVTIVLISILAFAVAYIFMEGFRSYIFTRDIIDLRSEARSALKRMVFEIRQAEDIPVQPGTSEFSASVDTDNNGLVETVRYYIDGSNLRRQSNGSPNPGSILLGNIQSGTMSALPSGNPTYIILDFTLSKGTETMNIRTRAGGRCL